MSTQSALHSRAAWRVAGLLTGAATAALLLTAHAAVAFESRTLMPTTVGQVGARLDITPHGGLLASLAEQHSRGGGGGGGGSHGGGGGGGNGGGGVAVPRGGSSGGGSGSTGGSQPQPTGGGQATTGASRPRDDQGRSSGGAVERRGGRPVIVTGGYYGGFYPWGWGGLGFGGYLGLYDPWWFDGGTPDDGYYAEQGEGALKLKVHPREAEVYVDGYFAGAVDDFDGAFQSLKLDAGPHRIEIRLDGYDTLSFDVRIAPDRTVTYKGEMKKKGTEN